MIAIRNETIMDATVTRAKTLIPDDGQFQLDDACWNELVCAAGKLQSNRLPMEGLKPRHFDLTTCAVLMARIRQKLFGGCDTFVGRNIHVAVLKGTPIHVAAVIIGPRRMKNGTKLRRITLRSRGLPTGHGQRHNQSEAKPVLHL